MLLHVITFLFDLDGVIYRGNEPVHGAADAVAALRAAGHHILFATNNATQRREEFVAKLERVGVPAIVDDLATSASATAWYLSTLPQPPASALVIGASSLARDLEDVGIQIVDVESADSEQPDCVVASLDRDFSYQKLARAQTAVLGGAMLVATNKDPQFPGSSRLWPGAGSIVAAVEAACQKTAISIGKPGPLLYKTLLDACNADLTRTVVVGDNLETDIAAAAAMRLPSILVLTGISQRRDVERSPAKPSWVVDNLLELLSRNLDDLFSPATG
jgi:HAD superfamily hydrolase (TIGR01450 family)